MHLFRSEEHLRNWVDFDPQTEDGMMPMTDLMKWFSLDMFKKRLEPDYITKSAVYFGDFVKPLLEMGKTQPFWIGNPADS